MNHIVTDELLSKFFAGEATPDEAMRIEDWRAESDLNQSHFNECAKIFETPERLLANKTELKTWEKVNAAINYYPVKRNSKLLRRRLGIAASVLILVTIGIISKRYLNKPNPGTVYSTVQEQRKIRLSDGSEITMAANSTLSVDKEFGKSNRHILFQGSAFFAVKHDAGQPLIVDLSMVYVEDMSTQFYINSSKNTDSVFVYVHEGKASVYDNAGSKVKLITGERALYIRSAKKLVALKNKQAITPGEIPIDQKADTRTKADSSILLNKSWDSILKKICDTCTPRLPKKPVSADSARKAKGPAISKPANRSNPSRQ